MDSKIAIRITQILFWIGIGLLLLSSVHHEYNGGITWDEMTERRGTIDQARFAIQTLKGNEAHYSEIHSNLEFYGVINKIIPLATQMAFGLSLRGYFIVAHVMVVILTGLTCALLYWASSSFGMRNRWLAPLLLVSTPVYSGHSIFNIKDIPFAFLYTAFTCVLINYSRSSIDQESSSRWAINPWILLLISSVIGGGLASMKMVMLVPIILTQMLALILTVMGDIKRRLDRKLSGIHIPSLTAKVIVIPFLTAFLSLALIPASWQQPVQFTVDAFRAFSNHKWGGCMNFNGTCIGSNDPSWNTAMYLIRWGSAKLSPLNIIMVLLLIAIVFGYN